MRQSWLRTLRTLRSPLGAAVAGMLLIVLGLAIVAPIALHHRATAFDVAAMQQGMSGKHWLGTDGLGRDVLARTLVATRLSIELAVITTLTAAVGGVLLGALPTVLGRRLGRLVSAFINLLVAFPGLLLALFLAVVFGVGARGAVFALAASSAPSFARLTETLAASIGGSDYIAAARVLGVRRRRMIVRHVLPNIAEPLLLNATVAVGGALLAFAGLSFLGFGVQSPSYDWGRLLNEGLSRIYVNPAASLAPGVAVVFAGLAFSLLGEAAAQVAGIRSPRRQLPIINREPPSTVDDGDSGAALRVEGLTVTFPTETGEINPVVDVSFSVGPGEILGVVGESGSGKSLTAAAIAGLVPHPGVVTASRLDLAGADIRDLPDRVLGTSVAMVFQDPMAALNPTLKVGRQLAEVVEVHQGADRRTAMDRALDRLRAVRIPAAERRIGQYPHEFSGGMRQRAVIGIGLMATPTVILADEPTTALDVTVQRQVLALLRQVRDEQGSAIVLISHDIGVVAGLADRVIVMYGGRIVEDLRSAAMLSEAAHHYTRALVATVPDMAVDRDRPLATISGRPPDPTAMPPGCAFAPRCPAADAQCETQPTLAITPSGGRIACWHPALATIDVESGRSA